MICVDVWLLPHTHNNPNQTIGGLMWFRVDIPLKKIPNINTK